LNVEKTSETKLVAICIPTFGRCEGLSNLLRALGAIELSTLKFGVIIVVCDNNPDPLAASIVESLRPEIPFQIIYRHEPRPGISHARNCTVATAMQHADAIAFIDDDELPEPNWIASLMDAQDRLQADVVCGPVIARLTDGTPEWIRRGRFFDRPRYETGLSISALHARTGNALITSRVFANMSMPFEPELSTSGGEDTHFFLRIEHQGFRIVWADDAIVHEVVPLSRMRPIWLLRRAFRIGNTEVRIQELLGQKCSYRVIAGLRGVSQMSRGLLKTLIAAFTGCSDTVRSLELACKGLGIIAACFNIKFHQYGRGGWCFGSRQHPN
jgi:succinoglycan biosynthesis protein ExoM